ncbi:hypothetical protein [Flavobacterium sp. XGLA_31]|uniref:hypothetical protein n=1 Tax=Flavobacterium sp. XGLA_31 TaxID=3447666 RepID=UPI003F3733D1
MKIKTFWTTIIKILGLLLIFEFLEIGTQLLTSLTYIFVPNMEKDLLFPSILSTVCILILYLGVISLFLFKSSLIVNKLKLDRDSETEVIKIDFKVSTIITIAVIIIGGVIFINGLSLLGKSLYDYFQQKKLLNYNPNVGWIIFNSIKALLGYLLMTNSKPVANYISKQSEID